MINLASTPKQPDHSNVFVAFVPYHNITLLHQEVSTLPTLKRFPQGQGKKLNKRKVIDTKS